MRDWGAKKDLTLPQQHLFLKANQNSAGEGDVRGGKLIWLFQARPTPLSRSYTVRIEYKFGKTPDVFVRAPDLTLLAGSRELPHVYHSPLRLCLYMPSAGQWTATKRLDQTIVPWTYTWLYYFEDWLAFGEWKGGGRHPADDPEPTCNRRVRRHVLNRSAGGRRYSDR